MILILTKSKHENKIDAQLTIAAEGIHEIGTLHFPNQITWTRFQGALLRGCVGMRDLEVRIDVKDPEAVQEPAPTLTGATNPSVKAPQMKGPTGPNETK